jgi:hypothetical protein
VPLARLGEIKRWKILRHFSLTAYIPRTRVPFMILRHFSLTAYIPRTRAPFMKNFDGFDCGQAARRNLRPPGNPVSIRFVETRYVSRYVCVC